MYDSLDKIGLKTVLEAIKGKIPTSLPANGGNSDTVDGLHANDFIYPRAMLSNVDLNTILYPCSALAMPDCTNIPTSNSWGTLLCYSGGTGSHVQLWVSALDSVMYKRHYDGTIWSDWKEISTTPIKSTVFGMTTNGQAWVDTGLPVATTKIISVLCSTQSMVGYVWQLDGYSTWCASFYYTSNVATPVPNTPVSFTIYYFEE